MFYGHVIVRIKILQLNSYNNCLISGTLQSAFHFYSFGDSIIEVATELKRRKAKRIFAAATFGLFTNGMEKFDKAYEEGIIDGILTTNLIYQTPNLLSKPYYINCDMSKYIALIIDTLNHDGSLSEILSPNERIQNVLQKYKNGETI